MSRIKFKNENSGFIERPKYYNTIEDCDCGDLFMYDDELYLMVDTCSLLIFNFNTNELKDFEDFNIQLSTPIAMYYGEIEVDIKKFSYMQKRD